MNRDELDAFFAKAEDVLTDWAGSQDSMSTTATLPPSFLHFLTRTPEEERREMIARVFERSTWSDCDPIVMDPDTDFRFELWQRTLLRMMPVMPLRPPLFVNSCIA